MSTSLPCVYFHGQRSVDDSAATRRYFVLMTRDKDDPQALEFERRARSAMGEMGDRLRTARKRKGLTLEAVGAALGGRSKAAIGHYETGARPFSAYDLITMCNLHGVGVEWVATGANARELPDDLEYLFELVSALESDDDRRPVIEFAEDRLRRAGGRLPPRKTTRKKAA